MAEDNMYAFGDWIVSDTSCPIRSADVEDVNASEIVATDYDDKVQTHPEVDSLEGVVDDQIAKDVFVQLADMYERRLDQGLPSYHQNRKKLKVAKDVLEQEFDQ